MAGPLAQNEELSVQIRIGQFTPQGNKNLKELRKAYQCISFYVSRPSSRNTLQFYMNLLALYCFFTLVESIII